MAFFQDGRGLGAYAFQALLVIAKEFVFLNAVLQALQMTVQLGGWRFWQAVNAPIAMPCHLHKTAGF